MKLNDALQFLESIDALKTTYRQCLVMNGARNESTAEHTFSLAMAVLSLSSFANEPIDVGRALKMALFHDLAEALTGDTFHYDKSADVDELAALREVCAPLKGTPLYEEIISLWQDFEHGSSAEAIFLRGIDRFLPMYHNYKTAGHSWIKHGITREKALEKNAHIESSSTDLWSFTRKMLDDSQRRGWIK